MKTHQGKWILFFVFFVFPFLSCQEDKKNSNPSTVSSSLKASEDFKEFSEKKESCADPEKKLEEELKTAEAKKEQKEQVVPSLQGGSAGCTAH